METCWDSSNSSSISSNENAGSHTTSTCADGNSSASEGNGLRYVERARICGSGERVTFRVFSGMVMMWSASEKREIRRFCAAGTWVASIILTWGGRLLVCGCENGNVQVWNVEDGTQVEAIDEW